HHPTRQALQAACRSSVRRLHLSIPQQAGGVPLEAAGSSPQFGRTGAAEGRRKGAATSTMVNRLALPSGKGPRGRGVTISAALWQGPLPRGDATCREIEKATLHPRRSVGLQVCWGKPCIEQATVPARAWLAAHLRTVRGHLLGY